MQAQAAGTPNRLRELREARSLKLYDISALTRRDPATIYRWEMGRSPIPDDMKAVLAEFYGVTRAQLMGWDDDEPAAA